MNKRKIGLIALDLDGTLLNEEKHLTEENRKALQECIERGVYIVPTTGRTLEGIPQEVKSIPGVRYAITVNGGRIMDQEKNCTIDSRLLSPEQALQVIDVVREYPVMYDAYINGRGVCEKRFLDHLEEYGITYEDIEAWGGQVAHNDLTTIVDAFKDGQTDLFIHNVTLGHASLTELAVTIDLNFLQMPQDMIDSMCEKYNFSTAVLPAGSFNGQDEDINCLSLTTNLVASSAMSDGVAYAITKALCENTEALHAGHVALEDFTPERACDPAGLGIPLHPGAQAYFEEAGLM